MSLKDCIARDITNIFLNTNDFCDDLTLQIGTTRLNVIGSLQSNCVQNNSGNSAPLQDDAWTLYIAYPLSVENNNTIALKLLSAGTRITINDKVFSVVSVSDEMGLATVNLTTKMGR